MRYNVMWVPEGASQALRSSCALSEPVRALTKIRGNAKNSDWMLYFDT